MIKLFNDVSQMCSRKVTESYSTSFSTATNLLGAEIKPHIHNIYGFVRFADEIVDTFHNHNKEALLNNFERDWEEAKMHGISLNPILNSFLITVKKYQIDDALIEAFLKSMRADLHQSDYTAMSDYQAYIYGSAEVVGLMCLKVFVNGNQKLYDELKESARHLGSAFQKVNFLRDLKSDLELLNRSYFPHIDLKAMTQDDKEKIVAEIEYDFNEAFKGIMKLPSSSKFGVYTAFRYYKRLLGKLKATPPLKIMETRIRVNNYTKASLVLKSFMQVKMNLL